MVVLPFPAAMVARFWASGPVLVYWRNELSPSRISGFEANVDTRCGFLLYHAAYISEGYSQSPQWAGLIVGPDSPGRLASPSPFLTGRRAAWTARRLCG
jgi:hypothetical protein